MEVRTSAYDEWCHTLQNNDKKSAEQTLRIRTRQLFYEHKQILGSRRLCGELKKEGFEVGRYKTRRLMKD